MPFADRVFLTRGGTSMALFGRDYDEGYRGGEYGSRSRWASSGRPILPNEEAYGRSGGGRPDEGWGYGYSWGGSHRNDFRDLGYDRGYFPRRGYDRGFSSSRGYDRSFFGGRSYDRDYGREYKSDWQTDHGDPFGDRQRQTPIRMIRGEPRYRGEREDRNRFFGGYDESMGYRGYSGPRGYDRPYYGRPWGPYGRDVF
jgi:hypothetical protein